MRRLFNYVCMALVDGSVAEIRLNPPRAQNVVWKVQALYEKNRERVDSHDPKNIDVMVKEIQRVIGTRYRQRMLEQYEYLFNHPEVELEDLDLEKM